MIEVVPQQLELLECRVALNFQAELLNVVGVWETPVLLTQLFDHETAVEENGVAGRAHKNDRFRS